MSLLLSKELRLVLPSALLVAVTGLLAAQLIRYHEVFRTWALMILLAGGTVVSALGIGQEYVHRTLDLQLALPVSRQRLWWTKLLALAAALIPIQILSEYYNFSDRTSDRIPEWVVHLWLPMAMLSVSFWSWKSRSAIAGCIVGCMPMLVLIGSIQALMHSFRLDGGPLATVIMSGLMLLFGLAHGWLYLREWNRGESRSNSTINPGIHGWKLPSIGIRSRRDSALQSLFLKEFYLQTPALFTTVGSLVLSLIGWVVSQVYAEWEGVQFMGVMIQVAIVPLLIGSTAVAEERALESHQVMACLPPSWKRMFAVKLATGGMMVLFLSVLLPVLLLMTFKGDLTNSGGKQVLLSSGLLWAVGLFAGSLTKGTMKAILLGCGILALLMAEWIAWRLAADFLLKAPDGLNPVSSLLLEFQNIFPAISVGSLGESNAIGILIALYLVPVFLLLIGVAMKLGRRPQVSLAQKARAFVFLIGITLPMSAVMQESLRLMNLF